MNMLREKLHNQFTRADTAGITIREFTARFSDKIDGLKEMVDSFISAWNAIVSVEGGLAAKGLSML